MTQLTGILGAGESGAGAAVLAKKLRHRVFVSDFGRVQPAYRDFLHHHQIEWEEGRHDTARLMQCDLIVKSPGIPDTAPIVQQALSKGIRVISEIEFAGLHSQARKICITGSNGKTTTTLLTHHILEKAGLDVGLAGNVGKSLALQVAERDRAYFVIEVSSFQLDGMYDFKADIGILLNITPDHLDRYAYDFQQYVNAKFRLLQNMTPDDHFIYYAEDEVITRELSRREVLPQCHPFGFAGPYEAGAWIHDDQMTLSINHKPISMSIFDFNLQGKHNAQNSMAAGIAARVLDIRKETIRESLADFQGVEHRLEPVIKVHGIEFINDSKATNVNSTWYALETMKDEVVWIAGGIDKGNDYSILFPLVREKVKALVCLGKDSSKLHAAFDGIIDTVVDADSMEDAVKTAYYLSQNGGQVLLSPACASFDLFDNYEDRGRQFKQAVRNL